MDNYNSTPQFPVHIIINQNTFNIVTFTNQSELFPNINGPIPTIGNNLNNHVEIREKLELNINLEFDIY